VAGGNEVIEAILEKVEELVYDVIGVDENTVNNSQYYVSAEIVDKLSELLSQLEE
jgi:K+-transporting ATPase A subunit